jgi:hypothetical protein
MGTALFVSPSALLYWGTSILVQDLCYEFGGVCYHANTGAAEHALSCPNKLNMMDDIPTSAVVFWAHWKSNHFRKVVIRIIP